MIIVCGWPSKHLFAISWSIYQSVNNYVHFDIQSIGQWIYLFTISRHTFHLVFDMWVTKLLLSIGWLCKHLFAIWCSIYWLVNIPIHHWQTYISLGVSYVGQQTYTYHSVVYLVILTSIVSIYIHFSIQSIG